MYRNLDRLCETGDLLKFKEPNQDSWYYQYSSDHDHCDEHMHAQCSECGRIFHLEKSFADTFEKKVLGEYGLMIDPSKTMVIGKCDKCRCKKRRKKKPDEVRANFNVSEPKQNLKNLQIYDI